MSYEVWVVKDPGLGYKDYGHKDYMDALSYNAEYLGKWKGEQKMGTFDKAFVNGGLYCKDDDGNFVKIMTVSSIETDNIWHDDEITEIKVKGYAVPDSEAEKVEVNNTNRRLLGSISEKYNFDDHVYFMIFDGTTFSVKIDRTFIGLSTDYNMPYRVTVYDAGHILWVMTYQTWHDLECLFLHEVMTVLNACPSPFTIKYTISRMLRSARRVVKYHYIDDEREDLEREKNRMKTFLNCVYGYGTAMLNNAPMTVSSNIDKVIFDDPATVILWRDGTKTVVHAQNGERYDKEKGFAMAVCKKVFGNERDYYHVFKRWFRKGEDRSIKRLVDKLGNNGSKEE